jgi:hypothetical protein
MQRGYRRWCGAYQAVGLRVVLKDIQRIKVLELPAGSSTPVELPFTGLNNPLGVAVETISYFYVYVVDSGNGRVLETISGPAHLRRGS